MTILAIFAVIVIALSIYARVEMPYAYKLNLTNNTNHINLKNLEANHVVSSEVLDTHKTNNLTYQLNNQNKSMVQS